MTTKKPSADQPPKLKATKPKATPPEEPKEVASKERSPAEISSEELDQVSGGHRYPQEYYAQDKP